MVGLVGANGAGKSTLVNALAGWSRGPAVVSGNVDLEGQNMTLASHQRVSSWSHARTGRQEYLR